MQELINVTIVDGQAMSDSMNVSGIFGKRHNDVVSKIDDMKMSNDFRLRNFSHTDIIDKNGDKQNGYLMTRDGWSFLVMGFTGEKAGFWKEKYIDAFNKMEAELSKPVELSRLDILEIALKTEKENIKLKADNEEKTKQLEVAKPKIEFHDELIESSGLYSIGETAKLFGTGRTRFFVKLREMKVFFNTEPYQTYKERGYFEVKTTTKNGCVRTQAFTTPKGLEWLRKKLKSDGEFQTSF